MADFDTTTTTTTTYPYVSTAQATIDTSQIVTTGQFTEVEKPEEPDKPESNQKSYEELVLELAKVNAERARFKNSIDKLTHENSELNKWKKERMTAQEQQDEADAEAAARQAAYLKELEDYRAINEASKRYIGMGMDVELATSTATAEIKGDMSTVMSNIQKHQQDALTAAKSEWLKSRPEIPEQKSDEALEAQRTHDAFFSN